MRYSLISSDSHVNEPPDLWTSRVSARFRDQAPRIASFEQGDGWVLHGVADPINFGMNACAGLPLDQWSSWVRFADIRRGGYDAKVRLTEQDFDGVDAEILFPTPRLSYHLFALTDRDMHNEFIRCYNDWLCEYVSEAPDRFGGVMLLPNRGVKDAVDEVTRIAGTPGIRGVLMGAYPHGDLNLSDEDDPLWDLLAELRLPLHIHVSLVQEQPAAHAGAKSATDLRFHLRIHDAPGRVMQFVFGSVFERFRDLSLVMVEVDCGWVPYFKEQTDDRYERLSHTGEIKLARRPSEYIESNVWWSFITDTYGVRNRAAVGVDRMMWATDYPHMGANWPHSWRHIESSFSGVPRAERDMILAGNAVQLYGFDR